MMEESFEIYKKYPYIAVNHDSTKWTGSLNIKGFMMDISICTPHYPSMEMISLKGENDDTRLLLQNHSNEIHKIEATSKSLLVFLDRLCKYLNEKIPSEEEFEYSKSMDVFKRYNRLCEEIKELGEDSLVNLSADITEITLKTLDWCDGKCEIKIKINEDYPDSSPNVIFADVPDVCIDNINAKISVSSMYQEFCYLVNELKDFWRICDALNSLCTVIDPALPSRKDVKYTIAVNKTVSLILVMDPLDPYGCPEMNLLGGEKYITPFRNSIERTIKDQSWNYNGDFIQNLLDALGLEEFMVFEPMEDEPVLTEDTLLEENECSICFTYRLQNSEYPLPSKICENEKCTVYYHTSCLAQWFLSIPMNEPDVGVIAGSCPNCKQRIVCPLGR